MPNSARRSLQDGDLLAAVDLGSNSFHLVVARYTLGQLRVVDRIKEMVRMAEGLDGNGGLRPDVAARALECLARFGQKLRSVPPAQVRAIATNTVRQLRNPQSFLLPAETALGHGIEVVAGREEARLCYLGVAHGHPPGKHRRLVIDIGGGSTEFIVGDGLAPIERESLQMGCVATTKRFFGNGRISRKRWKDAQLEMAAEFQQFATLFRQLGWKETFGSSGTIKAIGEICEALKLTKGGVITDVALAALVERVLAYDTIDSIKLPGLGAERQSVIAGGLLVLSTAFEALDLRRLHVSESAMREGILHDMVGRSGKTDPREESVAALSIRYAIDAAQAEQVEATALALFDQVDGDWGLEEPDRQMLSWAARLHELGLAIAHSQYHVHGAYILENSDIAGFSRTEQQVLATLVRNQRRALRLTSFEGLTDRLAPAAQRCAMLLRLAVLLHRAHEAGRIPGLKLRVGSGELHLKLSKRWLDAHPLTRADLDSEREHLQDIGFRLEVDGG
jgi:exopolyphosphatase/guanosine-5'-triphosphate,3'-diphosphate pyrophosphatase